MSKVLVADKLSPAGMQILEAAAGIEVVQTGPMQPTELAAKIPAYDALIIRSGSRVTAEVVEAAANLKAIGRAGIGVDNIDVAAATKKGIVVMNTPAGNNVTTAEHAISMMLALARQIPQATASMKSGKWEKSRFVGSEVFNKVFGVVGLGNIGSLVAERALGLKMRVIAYDPFISKEVVSRLGIELVELDDLYARAEFITVHTPLLPETRNLISSAAFDKMKPGVRIINCARGGIVDEKALYDAIKSGKVVGAALDVFAEEPPTPDHPLVGLDEVICTPHLGAATDEAQTNVAVAIAQQIVNFLETGEIKDAVNVPSISAELRAVLGPYLVLGEKLGRLQAQLLDGTPREVTIEYAGEVTKHDVKPLTMAVLHGLLARALSSNAVNYVNAPAVAHERGIKVVEARVSTTKGFSNMMVLRVQTTKSTSVVAGVIFGQSVIRLVRINDFFLDADPEGYILMLHNQDVPGVVGNVGTVLAECKINIARLELGRERIGGKAISLIHVDEPVPDDVLNRLRTLPNIIGAQLLEL